MVDRKIVMFVAVADGLRPQTYLVGSYLSVGRDARYFDVGCIDDEGPEHVFDIVKSEDGYYQLIDRSGNGTSVDGSLVENAEIVVGVTQIQVGSFTCFLQEAENVMSTTPVVVAARQISNRMVVNVDTPRGLVRLPLPRSGEVLVVGRSPDSDIRIDEERVSGRHLEIYKKGRRHILKDMSSTNGTWIGNVHLFGGTVDIFDGMQVQVGSTNIWFDKEVKRDFEEFYGIIYADSRMGKLVKYIESIANNDQQVLILGETGTGKQKVAEALHSSSARSKKPLIELRLNSVAESLVESELFGHEKGSFTGAISQKIGHLERADGSTLFLDEIGELSPKIQVKLLQAIETKTFSRIGGTKTIHSNFRLVAATNRDLLQMVKEGKFREDLYHRLRGVELHIPPLRERPEDIRVLIEHVALTEPNRTDVEFSEEALSNLLLYRWPGNVRELIATIRATAARLGEGRLILPEHLDFCAETFGESLSKLVSDYEKKLMKVAMRYANNNKAKASRILKINTKTFHSKVRIHELKFD